MECAYAPSNWQESAATAANIPVENVAGAYTEGYDVQIARILADQLGKELVTAKLRETAAHVIAMSVLVLNLRKIQCALFRLFTYLLAVFSPQEKRVIVQ